MTALLLPAPAQDSMAFAQRLAQGKARARWGLTWAKIRCLNEHR